MMNVGHRSRSRAATTRSLGHSPFTIQHSAFILLFLLLTLPTASFARPWPCLPAAFDHGQRLHPLPNPDVYWLEIMLRQHELCWRAPASPNELRIVLVGNSAVYGFPLPVEQTMGALLNDHFARAGIPAHVFNLAFVTPYQVRDALLINEALPYEPDVIIYPLTMAEFRHLAPMPFPTQARLFDLNNAALERLQHAQPAGLIEPVNNYVAAAVRRAGQRSMRNQLQDVGLYARRLARTIAENFAARFNGPVPPHVTRAGKRETQYKCSETERQMKSYTGWQDWNVLAYLEQLQNTRGIRSLVIHWPIAHEPVDDCYSIRYTNAAVDEFSAWIRAQSDTRHLAYLDLRDLLAPEIFIDSLHLTPQGHRMITDKVVDALDPLLRDVASQRAHKP